MENTFAYGKIEQTAQSFTSKVQKLPELENPLYRAKLIKAYRRIEAEYLKQQLLKSE